MLDEYSAEPFMGDGSFNITDTTGHCFKVIVSCLCLRYIIFAIASDIYSDCSMLAEPQLLGVLHLKN